MLCYRFALEFRRGPTLRNWLQVTLLMSGPRLCHERALIASLP